MAKDALEAAPRSHRKYLKMIWYGFLEVEIKPGEKEPQHTHLWRGVMIVTHPAKLRYYDAHDEVEFEAAREGTEWREPTGAHAVENIDTKVFRAYRVEVKK